MGFSKKKALYKHRIDEHQPTRIEDTVANTVVETGKRKKRIDKLRSNRRNCMKKDGRV